MTPTISVIMAAYNGAGLIEETIVSVLSQSFGDFELIVVDDCSTDDTLKRLRAITDPRVVVIAAEVNGGPVRARNMAFAAARGRYIVGLDQDDLCHPDRFAVQMACLEANPDTVLVASSADLLEDGAIKPPRGLLHSSPALIDWRMQFGNPLVWSSVMFRGDVARRLEVFERTDRMFAEDYDLYTRLARFGALARIDRPLVTYRIHPGGASKRYLDGMIGSATAVLAEGYSDLFGPEACNAARMILTHFTGGVALRDLVTLQRITMMVEAVHDRYWHMRRPGAADRVLIMAEYARLWWQMGDASVRSGGLSLDAVTAACPKGLQPYHPSARRAASSALIGAARALLERWKGLPL